MLYGIKINKLLILNYFWDCFKQKKNCTEPCYCIPGLAHKHQLCNLLPFFPLGFYQSEFLNGFSIANFIPFCRLVAALSVTLALFARELAGFFLGVSVFNSTQCLIYILSNILLSFSALFHHNPHLINFM